MVGGGREKRKKERKAAGEVEVRVKNQSGKLTSSWRPPGRKTFRY